MKLLLKENIYGVGGFACVCAKSLQLCLTLCNAMDCSSPGSSVHGLLQGRILEWVASPSFRHGGVYKGIKIKVSSSAWSSRDLPLYSSIDFHTCKKWCWKLFVTLKLISIECWHLGNQVDDFCCKLQIKLIAAYFITTFQIKCQMHMCNVNRIPDGIFREERAPLCKCKTEARRLNRFITWRWSHQIDGHRVNKHLLVSE